MGRVIVTEQGHAFGWRPDLPDHRDFLVEPPARDLIEEITKVPKLDLSVLPFMPSIWNQGQLGSCTAHSVGVAYEFAAHASGHPEIGTPSRLFIYYGERLIEHTVRSDAGAMIRDGIKVVAKQGAPSEQLWPYNVKKFATRPSDVAFAAAKKFEALEYRSVPQTREQIQACIAGGSPVTVGISVYDSLLSNEVARTGVVPMPGPHEALRGGHAIDIVGYTPAGATLRNSWSEGWGVGGYFSLPWAYLLDAQLAADFWAITKVSA